MRRTRLIIAAFVVAGLAMGMTLASSPRTDASWTTNENGTGNLTAGSLAAPTALKCTQPPLQLPTFSWTPPTTGIVPTGYHWAITTGTTVAESGDVTTTSVSIPSPTLLAIGSYKFTVYAEAAPIPGGWTSTTGPTGTYNVLLGVLSSCSVP